MSSYHEEESSIKKRIDEISQLIYEVANGNFDYKLERTSENDELDGIIAGVNMLGEELKSSTVSRDFIESIYKGVIDTMIILKPDLRIERVNDVALGKLNFETKELKSQPFEHLIRQDDHEVIQSIRERLKTEDTCHSVEIHLKNKNGDYIPHMASFSTLYDNSRSNLGILVLAKDITEQKEFENQLKIAKEKAESANEAKSNFLANMSHEIRTPLNGILGFIDLLLDSEPNTQQLHYLKLIKVSGESLSKLLNDMLDLNKIEQQKLSLEYLEFDFKEKIYKDLRPYKYLAEEKGIAFKISFDEKIPQYVIGDHVRINQVIRNLVTNAVKFTNSGEIGIRFDLIDQLQEDYVNIGVYVVDSGRGISEEKQKQIFDSFTQEDNSISRKFGGSGLGLTIAKYFVELMQGDISVESPPLSIGKEKGSLFRFNIQVKQTEQLHRPVVKAAPNQLVFDKSYNVLIVDDNEINLTLAKKVLENLGATFETATNGLEAIEKVHQHNFDLIFMDVQMPVMNGWEATTQLRDEGYTLPIIALSANVYKEHVDKCIDVGMNSHVNKPFSKSDIYSVITQFLS